MKLLTANLIQSTESINLDAAKFSEILKDEAFSGYVFNDKAFANPPKVYAAQGSFYGWPNLILEAYAQNSQLDRLKKCTGNEPILAIALDGDGFHGQHQRHWQTGKGNLYLSLYLPKIVLPDRLLHKDLPNQLQFLQMQPCHAVFQTLSETLKLNDDVQLDIKPPNDIIAQIAGIPHKIAGCLTEIRLFNNKLLSVCMGIGLNIQFAPEIEAGTGLPATCCAHILSEVPPSLYATITSALAFHLYQGLSPG